MTTLSATELKKRLGQVMEEAQHAPVAVEKGGRKYVVLISQRDYERFLALEDRYWSEKARQARKGGYLSPEETSEFIENRLREEEAA